RDGFRLAATRQNDGRAANAWLAAPPRPAPRPPAPRSAAGGMNPPGATACAAVIVAFGRASDARLSHGIPAAISTGVAGANTAAPRNAQAAATTSLMIGFISSSNEQTMDRNQQTVNPNPIR